MRNVLRRYAFDAFCLLVMALAIFMILYWTYQHDMMRAIDDGIHLLCWIGWYIIYRHSEKVKGERDALKVMCAGLVAALADKKPSQDPDLKIPKWRKCGPGHAFKEDAVVVGLGEDKDPRMVRCAVNASKYLLVSDLLKYLPEEEDKDAAGQ